jgi:hypothetical protein
MAYMVSPMNATSATPLLLGISVPVWDGRLSTKVVTSPLASIRRMRDPVLLPT